MLFVCPSHTQVSIALSSTALLITYCPSLLLISWSLPHSYSMSLATPHENPCLNYCFSLLGPHFVLSATGQLPHSNFWSWYLQPHLSQLICFPSLPSASSLLPTAFIHFFNGSSSSASIFLPQILLLFPNVSALTCFFCALVEPFSPFLCPESRKEIPRF